MEKSSGSSELKRTLGLGALVIYAIGDILGAGIYALIGKVAGQAGAYTWLAFVVALAVALVTACTYSEMAARFPRSGGASHFCQQAFAKPWLSQWVGWLVLWSGVISLAAASVAFCGYFQILGLAVSKEILVIGFLSLLGFVGFWGMKESSALNLVCTAVEFSGLITVIALGLAYLFGNDAAVAAAPAVSLGKGSIFAGAALAFFAFIGFEDLVNVAEEAKQPREHLPIACIGGLTIAGLVYVTIAWIAPRVMAPAELAASAAPLVDVVLRAKPGFPKHLFAGIALFAVANTALLNFIMASRLLYGMASEGFLPKSLAAIHARRRTPHVALLCVYGVALLLALVGPLEFLAATTSCLILAVFFLVHLALVRLKQTKRDRAGSFTIPVVVPALGMAVTAGLVAFIPGREQVSAAAVATGSFLIVFFTSKKR